MDDVFNTVLRMSLTGSYAIVIILLVRASLKRAPKWITYVLWSVAGFRLMIPVTIKSPLSLLPKSTKNSGLLVDEVIRFFMGVKKISIGSYDPISLQIMEQTTSNSVLNHIWRKDTLIFIWLMGATLLILHYIYAVLKTSHRLKSARKIDGNVYEADHIKTPFVFGWTQPKIYLSCDLSLEEKEYILVHEEIHVRRKDTLVKTVFYGLVCIHWFNPLVWIAFSAMSADMELSCDEKVLKEKGIHIKKNYATSLLTLASPKVSYSKSQLAFGQGTVKARIKNALNYKKPRFFSSFLAVFVAVLVGIGLGTNPPKDPVLNQIISSYDLMEREEKGTQYELVYDKNALHAYGKNYIGILQTVSYSILPEKNVFDFNLVRGDEILTVEIVFPSSEKESLYFVVDLINNKVLHKAINEGEYQLSEITDEEFIDMAISIRRMTVPLTDWTEA